MNFTEQNIKGVYLIEPDPHEDDRGMLRRHFCQNEFSDFGLMTEIKQTNISENKESATRFGKQTLSLQLLHKFQIGNPNCVIQSWR